MYIPPLFNFSQLLNCYMNLYVSLCFPACTLFIFACWAGLWLIYDYITLFTRYGHKILFYTVLTVAVSDLHYSTLCLQRQCLI